MLTVERDGALNYVVWTPLRYDEDRKSRWPVLCFLHGFREGQPADILTALTTHGPLRPGSSSEVERFIIVAPQQPQQGDFWYSIYAEEVRQIVETVQQSRRVIPEQTYLTGFSYGGKGALEIGLHQCDFWAALWPVDPSPSGESSLNLKPQCQRPIWLSLGQHSRRNESYLQHVLGLKSAERNPNGDRLCSDKGEDHPGTALANYQDDQIYRWLRTKRLP